MTDTLIRGLDADQDLTPHLLKITGAGFKFIMAYSRILTPKILAAYHGVGLKVGVIDERQATRALGGANAGAIDGKAALAYMQKLGAPPAAAVFATVDTSAGNAQLPPIEDYFAAYDGFLFRHYQIGAYADGTVQSGLRQHGLSLSWLAGAGGWPGSHDFALTGKPQLIQGPTIGLKGGLWTPAGTATALPMPALGFEYDPNVATVPLDQCGLW